MKILTGDLIALGKGGTFDVIVHGCNCFCVMGAGLAKAIRSEFPEVYRADQGTEPGDREKLGTIHGVLIEGMPHKLVVVNAYTQYHYGRGQTHADYDAIRSAFRNIRAMFAGLRIGYPRIGAGLAGGDWERIAAIINEELAGEDHSLVVVD